jgi:hypothetical protein
MLTTVPRRHASRHACSRNAVLFKTKLYILDHQASYGKLPCCVACGSNLSVSNDGHMKDAKRVTSLDHQFIYARAYRCKHCPGTPGTHLVRT